MGDIKEDEADSLWALYKEVPLMVDGGVITKEEGGELAASIKTSLREALGLGEE